MPLFMRRHLTYARPLPYVARPERTSKDGGCLELPQDGQIHLGPQKCSKFILRRSWGMLLCYLLILGVPLTLNTIVPRNK